MEMNFTGFLLFAVAIIGLSLLNMAQ